MAKEWIAFTLIFFFLYDVIWAIADFKDFKQNFENDYLCLFLDLIHCGIFSFVSLSTNYFLFKHKFFNLAGTERGRFLKGITVTIVVNLFIAGLFDLLINLIDPEFMEYDVWGTYFLFGIIASLLALIHLLLHYSDLMIRMAKENVSLQKKYLKLQLDPHFVFNSLSSLAGMIDVDPQMAEEYVVRLSHVYRYMLRHIEQDYITIREAMDFAKMYISLLNMRYSDKIILEANGIQGKSNDCILALSLQLLLENAIKHNAPNEDSPLYIQIGMHGGMLTIKNNRIYTNVRNDQTIESYGIGLQNLKQRYELECGKEIGYTVTHDNFEINLPIIKKQQ